MGVSSGSVIQGCLLRFVSEDERNGRAYVGCRCDGEALGTRVQREDLASDNPGDWSPGGSKEEDIDTDKGDTSPLRRDIIDDSVTDAVLSCRQSSQHGDNKLRNAHADGTPEKERAATPLVDGV